MSLLSASQLYDEKTFYQTFLQDLDKCRDEVIIESPYITCERMRTFDRIFQKLLKRGVKIYVITRDPKEHTEVLEVQAEEEIKRFEILGIQPLLCIGNHHRKLAILDRKILWEGSLNILSQTFSREIMRRIEDEEITQETFNFLNLAKFL
ncbi:MAG: phospholipase D-like domain-containing protein [Actinobacteria bacterium]|nr:phospholipase D-like domain-containing protein [Actinomycetota bacterium]